MRRVKLLILLLCLAGCSGKKVSGGQQNSDDGAGGGGGGGGGGNNGATTDTTPPDIVSAVAVAHTLVHVSFSEALAADSVAAAGFTIQGANHGIAVQQAAILGDGLSVELTVAAGMQHGATYTLLVQGVTDVAGNVVSGAAKTFLGRGAVVAVLEGAPPEVSQTTSATIGVGGADVTSYQFSLDTPAAPGTWSAETPVETPIELTAMVEGPYLLRVVGKDSLGNWQAYTEPTTTAWTVDVQPPVAELATKPQAVTTSRSATFVVGGQGVVAYSYSLDGGPWSDEASVLGSIELSLLAAGDHSIAVIGRDAAGNWQARAEATSYDWYVDYSLPVAALSGLPADPTNQTSIGVTVGGPGVVGYRYRLDGGALGADQDVTSVIAIDGLGDGEHVLEVLAKDEYEGWQLDTAPSSYTWTVDTVAPTALLFNTPPAITSQPDVDCDVGGDDVAFYEFSIDGSSFSSAFTADTPLVVTGLTEGLHVLSVRGGDRAGNWQEVATDLAWEIDLTAPTVTLSNTPPLDSNSDGAVITVSGLDIVAYAYALDGGAWSTEQPVASPIVLAALAEGTHTLDVVGRDTAGNWQLTTNATTATWNVDLTPPTALIGNGPLNPTNLVDASFTVDGAEVVAYRYRLDGGAWSDELTVGTTIDLFGLVEGDHTLELIGRDLAHNWQDELQPTLFGWTIDLSPPAATLAQLPADPTNDTALAVLVAGAGVVAYRYALDGGAQSAEQPIADTLTADSLAEGTHALEVWGRDASGNWQELDAPTTYTWTVDLTPPTATVSGLPADPSNISGTHIVVGGAEVVRYRYKLDDGPWTGRFDVADPLALGGLSEGTHTLLVVGIDQAGNEDLASPITHTWTVDLSPPTADLTVVAPTSDPTNGTTVEIVVGGVDVVAYKARINGGGWSAEAPIATPFTDSGLSEGAQLVEVIGRDTAGNWQEITQATMFAWDIDLTAPTALLDDLPPLVTSSATASITVGGAEVVVYAYRLDGGGWSTEYAIADSIVLTGLSETTHTLDVIGRDAVGNWQDAAAATSWTWTVDLTAPTAFLSDTPADPTNATTAAITVSGSDIVSYSYQLDGGPWSAFTDVATPLLLDDLLEATHTLAVIGRDAADNTQEEVNATIHTWTVDLTAPTAVLSDLPADPTNDPTATITVGGGQVIAYRYRLDGVAWSAATDVAITIDLAGLSSTPHTLEVIGVDAADNWQSTSAPTTHTWTVDTVAPTAPAVSDSGATSSQLLLTFAWSNPGDAAEAALQVATDAAFTNVVFGGPSGASMGTAETYDYIVDPSNGALYYARARVRDAAGNWSDYGAASDGIELVGGITGNVKSSALAAISGASVELRRVADDALMSSATTDGNGDFVFTDVPIGANAYAIEVSAAGYGSATKSNITVAVGATTDVGVIYLVSTSAADGRIYGRVVHANDGSNIAGATVTIRDWDGNVVATLTSTGTGTFDTVTTLSPGTYTLVASKIGFFDLQVDNVVVDGNKNVGRQALCEILTEPHVRVVLLWGASPADLDLHVVGPSNQSVTADGAPNDRFHVYWRNQKSFDENTGTYTAGADPSGASSTTSLVQDDTSSYGPEAINLFGHGSGYSYGIFTFTVHKWSTSGSTWYDAPITLRIYDAAGMVREIPVPSGAGTDPTVNRFWKAFKLDIQGPTRAQRTLTVPNPPVPSDAFMHLPGSTDYRSKSLLNW